MSKYLNIFENKGSLQQKNIVQNASAQIGSKCLQYFSSGTEHKIFSFYNKWSYEHSKFCCALKLNIILNTRWNFTLCKYNNELE